MKTRFFTMIPGLLLFAVGALAQSSPARFYIPFDFHVGATTLPHGQYTVAPQPVSHIVLIRSEDNRHNVLVPTGAVEKLKVPELSTLTFNRYGDAYFLSEVWTAGQGQGRNISPSRLEREVARNAAQAKPEQVGLVRR